MVYLVIGCIGLGVMLLSLVLGDVFEFAHLDSVIDSELFSTAAISAFVGAFGFTAYMVDAWRHSLWLTIPLGLVVGALFAFVVTKLTRALQKDEGLAPNTNSLIGSEGTVISAIPSNGFGEIRVHAQGHPLKFNARSEVALEQGARVWVSAVVSSTAVEVRSTVPLDPAPERSLTD